MKRSELEHIIRAAGMIAEDDDLKTMEISEEARQLVKQRIFRDFD